MYAKRLSTQELEELLKQSTTRQAVALLKSLNGAFKELEDNPRRIKIKIRLDELLIEDIKKIYRLLDKNDKRIFEKFISIYEIKCIKSVFRKLSSSSTINEETNDVQNWVNKIFKNLIGIENVRNYEEFVEKIRYTPYYSLFSQYDSIEKINVFEIENKLDKFYFENMMESIKGYNSNLKDMIGKQIDLNNIIWICRVKKYYNFSNQKTKDILINKNYKLKKIEIEKLIEAKDENTINEILKNTYYAKYINFTDITSIEENIDRYLYRLYKKYFRGNIFDISIIYAYINMVDKENNDIINIIEGIRYNMNIDEIRKKLVKGIEVKNGNRKNEIA